MFSPADYAYLRSLGISSVVDLRTIEERQLAPTLLAEKSGGNYFAHDYSGKEIFGQLAKQPMSAENMTAANKRVGTMYGDWLVSLAPQYRRIFQDLLAGRGATVYHCSAGQDRTGVATALVLSALGVPRETIIADYHLSTTFRRPEFEFPRVDPAQHPGNPVAAFFARHQANPEAAKPRPLLDSQGQPLLAATFARIDERWGSVERYLESELGVGPAEIAALKANYLE